MTGKPPKDRDEDNVFRTAMEGVRRLKSDKVVHDATAKPKAHPRYAFDSGEEVELAELTESQTRFGDVLFFHRGGVQQRVLKRLRQGKLLAEATLDLHGYSRREARQLLLEFVNECSNRSLTQLRIIHGKGLRSTNDKPVLKSLVAGILPAHPEVLAFASAPREQGGNGAVNVLLRRKRF